MGASGNRHHEFGLVSVLVKSESDLISLLVRYTLFTKKKTAGWGVEFLSSAASISQAEALPRTGIPQLFGILYA